MTGKNASWRNLVTRYEITTACPWARGCTRPDRAKDILWPASGACMWHRIKGPVCEACGRHVWWVAPSTACPPPSSPGHAMCSSQKLSWEAKACKAKIYHAKKMSQPMWAAHEARSAKRKGAAAMRQNEPDCFCCAVSSLSGKIKSSEDCWCAGGCGVALCFEPARLSQSELTSKILERRRYASERKSSPHHFQV